MKKLFSLLCAVLMTVGLLTATGVQAQTRWTGVDVSTLNDGDEVFLYNVGTGRFMIHGGDWGIQGRLFYNDSGKLLKIYKNGSNYYFDTGMVTEKQGVAKYLICNVPGQSCGTDNAWATNNGNTDGTKTYTIIFDYGTSPELNSKYSKLVDTDKGETVVIPGDKGVTYQDGHDLYVLLVTERLKESGTLAAATLIHECRHAWQGSIQKYNGTMMQYLLQYNNEHYISPLECESCYKKQFVEKDAFTYEEKLCAALNNALK